MTEDLLIIHYPLYGGPLDGRDIDLPYPLVAPSSFRAEDDRGRVYGYYQLRSDTSGDPPRIAYYWLRDPFRK